MKELELEAEEYISDMDAEFYKDGISNYHIQQLAKKDFIAGATSKYVEKQKLEFAIEQLREFEAISWSVTEKIEELEKQLNEINP